MTPSPAHLVLVVDDDPSIRTGLESALSRAGYDVVEAADGVEGFERFSERPPDLVVTDLAMPRRDGFELIEAIRRTSATPVLVLSVRGAEADKVRALDLGADDFVVKPFSVAELLARVRALFRRPQSAGEADPAVLRFPDLVIDRERRFVKQGERDVKLTPIEFSILEILATSSGKPVSVSRLIAQVWNGAAGTSPDTVRVHVGTLRKKLEPDRSRPRFIVTEPWVGYRFLPEPETA